MSWIARYNKGSNDIRTYRGRPVARSLAPAGHHILQELLIVSVRLLVFERGLLKVPG